MRRPAQPADQLSGRRGHQAGRLLADAARSAARSSPTTRSTSCAGCRRRAAAAAAPTTTTAPCWPTPPRDRRAARAHAAAGAARQRRRPRRSWDGPDELRPLDAPRPRAGPAAGRGAPAVRAHGGALRRPHALPADGRPAGRAARPATCCRAPELGEEEFQADPQAGLAARASGCWQPRDRPGVTVVCSQGGAIPSVLRGARRALAGRPDGWPPSAKGSVWALGGRPGALLADYYRDFDPDPTRRPTAPR